MGKRIKDTSITEQTTFVPTLRLLVDKMDADPGADWLQARNIQLKHLGNTYLQGSTDYNEWHDRIDSNDTFFRFSSDGGTTWKDLNTTNIREGTNLYFTPYRVLQIDEVAATLANNHEHSNFPLLQNLIDNGDGNSFLTNDGTYKNMTGATGTFTTNDGKTITVTNGLITNIV